LGCTQSQLRLEFSKKNYYYLNPSAKAVTKVTMPISAMVINPLQYPMFP